jgi:signal transduction histidine kinase
LRVSPGVARTVCAATVAAMSAALALSRSRPPAVAIVSIDLGLIFVFALATFSREQQRLLAAVREAQAARAQAAALQERARLAREIHDVLAHSLTGLSVQLETARLMLQRASAPAEAVLQVEQAGALARTGLEETRRAVQALRGDAMPGPELLPALAAEFGEREGVPCQFSVRGAASADALGAEARLALYRTAQEALTNVRKHARASRVEMTLEWAEDTVSLSVVDHASAPAAVASALSQHDLSRTGGGYGLSGLRERAELLGGSLTAAPSGDGFRVVLRLPRSPRACDE